VVSVSLVRMTVVGTSRDLGDADAVAIAGHLDMLLAEESSSSALVVDGVPRAIVVPAGDAADDERRAAAALALLRPWRHSVRRVLFVEASSPHDGGAGIQVCAESYLETPLGRVQVSGVERERLLAHPEAYLALAPASHVTPWQAMLLQRVLAPGWAVLPVRCRRVTPEQVADAFSGIWEQPGSVVVVVAGTGAYHSNDERSAAAILAGWWEAIGEDVVGAAGLRGVLELARRNGNGVHCISDGAAYIVR
jgi:AmmeMemoRadiSam system protein B